MTLFEFTLVDGSDMYDILYVTTHLAKVCFIVNKKFGIHVIKFTCHTLFTPVISNIALNVGNIPPH